MDLGLFGSPACCRGALKGGGLALWRILRCNPWGGTGYDPVPGCGHDHSTDGGH